LNTEELVEELVVVLEKE